MKLPFDLSLKFVFRVLLPGVFAALGLTPLLEWAVSYVGTPKYVEVIWVATALLLGWLILLLDMPIYMLYEGRRWPKFLWNFGISREQRRLHRLNCIYDGYLNDDKSFTYQDYIEALIDRYQFPLGAKDGLPEAAYPTRLGNLINAFETYPTSRYGIDSVFYWPRLWVKLDKDLRDEVDGSQALADSGLYTSAALYFSGLMFLLYTGLKSLGWNGIPALQVYPVIEFLAIAIIFLTSGWIIYRIDLQPQAQFGEQFKALFDQYHSELNFTEITQYVANVLDDPSLLKAPAELRFKENWRYLQYYLVKPKGAKKATPVPQYRQAHPPRPKSRGCLGFGICRK